MGVSDKFLFFSDLVTFLLTNFETMEISSQEKVYPLTDWCEAGCSAKFTQSQWITGQTQSS